MGRLKSGFTLGRRTKTNHKTAPKRCFGHMKGVCGTLLPCVHYACGGGALNSSKTRRQS
jgi:hypothetical protein